MRSFFSAPVLPTAGSARKPTTEGRGALRAALKRSALVAAALLGVAAEGWAETPKGAASPTQESVRADADDVVFTYRLEGLEGELKKNVEAQLAGIPENLTSRSRYRSRVREAVREGLRALGHYRPSFEFRWDDAPERGVAGKSRNDPTEGAPGGDESRRTPSKKVPRRTLCVRVTPGEPVRIAGTDVRFLGDAAQDRAFMRLKEKIPPEGTVLHHGDYDAFKALVVGTGAARGYFDARFAESRLGVSPERNEAYWNLTYESGERYRFGEARFSGAQIREELLRNLVPWREGDAYDARGVEELHRRLSASGWFRSVMVTPAFDAVREVPLERSEAEHPAASEETVGVGQRTVRAEPAKRTAKRTAKVLPVSAVVTPKRENSMELGVGYSTDVGPRLKATWLKPWVNDRGHSLRASTALSAYEQELDGTYRIPTEAAPLEEYWLLQGGYKHTDLNDTKADSTSLKLSRFWEMETGWQRAVNLHWSLDNFTQGADENTTMLLYPGVSFSRVRTRGGLMPLWGDSQRYTLDVSNAHWGSDIDFIVFNAQVALVRTVAVKNRFLLRGNFGWIETNDFDEVPPDLRFFAGGDRSVRGYDYKGISPKDETGDLRGAARLLTGSVEYQRNVAGSWWGAVFADAGEAVDDFRDSDFKFGVGVGVRWASPIGPVKFDVAFPVGDRHERGPAFYIGIGPEF